MEASLMRVIVTVIGKDRVGIIANVCTLLAGHDVNILDISQTVLQEYFTMIMLADISGCSATFAELSKMLSACGEEQGLSIRIQREDIFEAMHRI
jgi:ACT domain-containing protein